MNLPRSPAPAPAFRLIPSRFPPIGLFDSVTTAADLAAVMELVGWTSDTRVAHRIARLPQSEWVHGRPNASAVMAAFLHVAPGGSRFNGPDLGAWYASADIRTAAAEVGHHLRREAVDRRLPGLTRSYYAHTCTLVGAYVDLSGRQASHPAVYAPDDYVASQAFGEALRAAGEDGIGYDSLRLAGGTNVAAFRPRHVLDVVRADHFRIEVRADAPGVDVIRLSGTPTT